MNRIVTLAFVLAITIFALNDYARAQQPVQQKINGEDRELTERMLQNIHDALKKNYYDPSFHGIDIDARYKHYDEQLKTIDTLGGAFRVVAAYLSGLNDSHTVFLPPVRDNIADYGFEMKVVGEVCYVTKVHPGSDAEQKIHPGDEILSLDGYKVGRVDVSQLRYYLRLISPKPTTDMTVRSPSGEARKVQIATRYERAGTQKHGHLLRQRYIERGDVMFWKMPTFLAENSEIDRMVEVARKHKTLVLDLRGNRGGSIELMKRLLGGVVDHDVTVGTRVMRGGQKPEIAKAKKKDRFDGNLIVLVDSDTGSASEVFARVVQLEHRGTVVGDRSSGSVMEAEMFPFLDNSGVLGLVSYGALITVADLIMIDGKSLEKVGVKPELLVLPTASQLAEGEDPVLVKAAELAGTKLDPDEAGKLFPFEWNQH